MGALSNRLSASVASDPHIQLLEIVNDADAVPSRGDISPCGWNVTVFRRSFPDAWGQYLRDRYRTAAAVQRHFPGIDYKTARDWIGGKRDPSGSFVTLETTRNPDATAILTGIIAAEISA